MDNSITPQKLYWTKDAFKYNHSIFSGAELVGEIKDKTLHRSVKATLYGQKYLFEKNGFVKTSISIINLNDRAEIGKISCALFVPRATIKLGSEVYKWRFEHMLTRKWVVLDRGNRIRLSGKSRKEGYTEMYDENSPVLLLCVLVIRNHFSMQGYS
ncbi:MAG: hypothetical protein JJ895_08320 [Balneolaceae bacterium]|nr:hypothetical protein [Balneolaceae bacterium]